MNNSEVKIMVEYLIDLPKDIQVSKVQNYLEGCLDEGGDSESVKSRIILDIEFMEQQGIIDSNIEMAETLGQLEGIGDDESINDDDKLTLMKSLTKTMLDKIEKKEEK